MKSTLDSSPLWGPGSRLKAALDLDWNDPDERQVTLVLTLQALTQAKSWVVQQSLAEGDAAAQSMADALQVAHQVQAQDVETTPVGTVQLRQGVAKDRRISVEDAEMRHGRKSKSTWVDGYKRHLLHDLDRGLVPNAPDASVTDAIEQDLPKQQRTLSELHINRADLSSNLVNQRSDELVIYCKAWSVPSRPVCQNRFCPRLATAEGDLSQSGLGTVGTLAGRAGSRSRAT